MIRKSLLVTVAFAAVTLIAADSAWACKFLDNVVARCHRTCQPVDPCAIPLTDCRPQACSPANVGGMKHDSEPILVIPKKETPKAETPAKMEMPTPPAELPKIDEPATKPQVPAEPPKPEPVKERDITPPAPVKPEPTMIEMEEPAVPAPSEPEPVKPEPKPAEEPKKAEEKTPAPAETPKKEEEEVETDAFGNPIEKNKDAPAEEMKEEPKADEPKMDEPKSEEPMDEPVDEEKAKDAEPADKPADAEKKSEGESADPFSKNDARQYRLWTDSTGEFQVEAKFVGFVDGKVRLQKSNGRYVRIEMNLLCQDDQRLIKKIETLAANW
jgi:hypothetical protein